MMGNGERVAPRGFAWSFANSSNGTERSTSCMPAKNRKYVIQTEEQNLSPVDAVRLYKDLNEVERAFSCLKDVIEMRPVYHQTDERVEAHLFVATLAFLVHRALEKKLKVAELDLSATEALQALRSVRVVNLQLGSGRTKRVVTHGTARANSILTALGIVERDPPAFSEEVLSA